MTLRCRSAGLSAPFLLMALWGGIGCSQSPAIVPATQAQAAAQQTDSPIKTIAEIQVKHTFVYKADKKLNGVGLVGSFNNWDKKANPMVVDNDGLTWRLTLPLNPGRYVYKFVPFGPDGEQPWIVDPNAPRDETDKVNDNSLLVITASDKDTDSATAKSATGHVFVYKADKKLNGVGLVGSFNNWDKKANPMVVDNDGLTWRLTLPLNPGRYVYKFVPFGPDGEQPWIVDPNAPRDETDKVNDNSLLVVTASDKVPAIGVKPGAHAFVFKAAKKLKAVSLVGSFNKWDKTASPMVVDGDGLTWRLTLPLDAGRYVYKFVQFGLNGGDDETWVVDSHAPLDETDKVNDNSLLVITPEGDAPPASPNDGKTVVNAVFHPQGIRDFNYDRGAITLSLRARTNDLSQIWLRSSGHKYPMKLVRSENYYSYYNVTLPWNRTQDLSYNFDLMDGKRVQNYGADGVVPGSRPFKISAASFHSYLLSSSTQTLRMNGPLTTQSVAGPSWAKNQPIYEINLDTYGFAKGTALREYEKHLPVLKEMGVGLLWFMPLQPRGQLKAFGSPYSVRDYTDINPDLGTKADFRHLVNRAHALGLHVLLDWVPNHTAWDNSYIKTHPYYYEKNSSDEIVQAGIWPDVAQLDYGKPGHWNQPLWHQMRDDMVFWVREFGVDGFRCDVAGSSGKVPAEFWNWLRPQLNAVKPVFMLAEGDDPYLNPAFDMTYSWNLPPVLWEICAGRKSASAIDDELRREARNYPIGAVRMRFLDNHDWHSHADWGWGSGKAIDTRNGLPQVAPLMVLCATLPGKPLLYNGQEMSLLKTNPPLNAAARLQSPVWPFYRQLLGLYQSQPALAEGTFSKIASNHDDKIYAFVRQLGANRVVIVVNLTAQAQTATLRDAFLPGSYRDWFGNRVVKLNASPSLSLAPWAYRIYVAATK